MRLFASLCAELGVSVGSQASLASLQRYFAQAGPADAAWALFLLLGGKTRRSLSAAQLRAEACAADRLRRVLPPSSKNKAQAASAGPAWAR